MKRLVARLKEVQIQEIIHKVHDLDGNDVTPQPLRSPFAQQDTPRTGVFSPCSSLAKSPSIPASDRSGEAAPPLGEAEIARLEMFLQSSSKQATDNKAVRPISSQQQQQECASIKLTLKETDTIWLLELPSTALPEDDAGADQLKEQIQRYDHLTSGKGRNRKLVDAETQTLDLPAKGKATMTSPIHTASVESYVSAWDLHDTYEKSATEDKNATKTDENFDDSDEDKFPIRDIAKFLESALILERLLAANNFKRQQAMFTAYPAVSGDLERSSRFQYELCALWVFKCNVVQSRTVMALAWNPTNKDLLAVGYGNLDTSNKPGLVCCWSTKNPTQPERSFTLAEPVTSLSFSRENSKILAVGTRDGAISLLDVANRDSKELASSRSSSRQHMGPVWSVQWVLWGHNKDAKEVLLSTGQDGQICRWILSKNFYCLDGAWLRAPHCMPCIDSLSTSDVSCENPVQKFLSGLDLSTCLNDATPTLYVATKEGYLVQLEMELQCRKMSKIHRGPIFSVQVSPFCSQISLTGGADGNASIWSKNSNKPLLTLAVSDSAVTKACWSPSHSTVLSCISDKTMSLWDIARKHHAPISCVTIDCELTSLAFCPSGKNLLVGDKSGNVHVFSLQEMPYPPCMQVEALTRAIPTLKHHLATA